MALNRLALICFGIASPRGGKVLRSWAWVMQGVAKAKQCDAVLRQWDARLGNAGEKQSSVEARHGIEL